MKLVWDRAASGEAISRITMDEARNGGLITIREAAASIRVSEETIRQWMKRGLIPYVPVGAFKMVRKADLLTKDAADGMPTARPRPPVQEDSNGDQTVHTTGPSSDAAGTQKAPSGPSQPRGAGQGKRNQSSR